MSVDAESIALVTSTGLLLRGEYRGQPGTPCVIYAHGLGSDRRGEKAAALDSECLRRGWGFAAFDFRGHGESDGRFEEVRCGGLLEDLDAAIAFAEERRCSPLFLFGSSMGGWAVAWTAVSEPEKIAACAAVAPALRFPELHFRSGDYPPEELAARLRVPMLLFHGMRDEVVPYQDSVELAGHCSGAPIQVRLYNDGDHRLNHIKADLARCACDFFAAQAPTLGGTTP